MIRSTCLTIIILFLAYNSVFSYSTNNGSSVFSSLRRTDYSTLKTYHLSKFPKYEPINEPILYGDGYDDETKMIVGFNNMLVFAKFENEKHYVIRVSDDLDEDTTTVPSRFLNYNDSGELFEVITLKPTTTTTAATTPRTTTTTRYPLFRDMIKDIQREAWPGFDPDSQSMSSYLQEVSLNGSRLAQSVSEGN